MRLLVDAGYHQAQSDNLSNFDKIIGGIAWIMEVFELDINVNIVYADSLDLGQKISLTERLVLVLLVLECPHQIEPHQIVGLDVENILPVISWLLDKSVELRRGREARNRHRILKDFRPADSGDKSEFFGGGEQPLDIKPESKEPQSAQLSGEEIANGKEPESKSVDLTVSGPDLVARAAEEETEELLEVATSDIAGTAHEGLDERELNEELIATNQKVLNLLKKVDSLPSQLETNQYRKRYAELQQQLSSVNKDLKNLYTLFNCLSTTKFYLTKEISLLDSISSRSELIMKSSTNRSLLLHQLEEIVEKLKSVKADMIARVGTTRTIRDSLRLQYAELLDQY